MLPTVYLAGDYLVMFEAAHGLHVLLHAPYYHDHTAAWQNETMEQDESAQSALAWPYPGYLTDLTVLLVSTLVSSSPPSLLHK
jgi:hypothetical protein